MVLGWAIPLPECKSQRMNLVLGSSLVVPTLHRAYVVMFLRGVCTWTSLIPYSHFHILYIGFQVVFLAARGPVLLVEPGPSLFSGGAP